MDRMHGHKWLEGNHVSLSITTRAFWHVHRGR